MIKSVIDIGTNTAHLLIGEVDDHGLIKTIMKHRVYTYLGEDGIDIISDQPILRLYQALHLFNDMMKEHGSQHVRIIATDALRSASNGPIIQSEIMRITGTKPEIISGVTEAELIRKGVELSLDKVPDNYLIMDIGGGSVEFIHVFQQDQVLLQSLPLGVSRLYERSGGTDVMDRHTIKDLTEHIIHVARDVISTCRSYPAGLTLIGSAGTFEIFLPEGHLEDPNISHSTIDIKLIQERYEEVIIMNMANREKVSWLPNVRSKYIVVALLLMHSIIKEISPEELIVSKYALKEGAITSE